MAELADIRAGLKTNLETISGIEAGQVHAYRLDNPTPPVLMVIGVEEAVPTAFRGGGYSWTLTVVGMVSSLIDEGAQRQLDEWLSPTGAASVWAAIETDRTLDGAVDSLAVTRQDGTQIMTLDNGTQVLGSTWHVQIEL